MKRSVIETVLGAVVLFIAGFFLVFSYQTSNVGSVDGYDVTADFSGIGGLRPGDEVQISGVKIGTIKQVDLDSDTYLARVTMSIDPKVMLPEDTAALISSESLLGGRYMSLEPGASDEMLDAGGHIQYTQAPQNLEQLLGQFIFSMQNEDQPAQ
jgi:phospholipid/cholesterol/gamma-HCH transport system substrate-binding protein